MENRPLSDRLYPWLASGGVLCCVELQNLGRYVLRIALKVDAELQMIARFRAH